MIFEAEKEDTIGFGFLYDKYCDIYHARVLQIHFWKWNFIFKWPTKFKVSEKWSIPVPKDVTHIEIIGSGGGGYGEGKNEN